MSKKQTGPRLGHIQTVNIIDGIGRKAENYRIDVLDEFGKKRRLLLTPLAFFNATRLFSRDIKGNPQAA